MDSTPKVDHNAGEPSLLSFPSTSDSEELVMVAKENATSSLLSAYLTLPQEILSMTKVSELEYAVELCKAAVLEKPDESDEKKLLVRRLIELRLRLHNVKEALKDDSEVQPILRDRHVVLGHHFLLQNHPKSLATHYCDRCSGVIWNAIHTWHLCSDCDYKCHSWCLNQVCRVCAHVVVTETPVYEDVICPEPEDGLAAQNYRCAECLTRTSHRETVLQPRLCDYTGKYYCPTCHWNSTAVIPARVVNNWDFGERRVSRASKQRLRLLSRLPIIELETLNPVLFASVDELMIVKRLRKQILMMKKYLTSCKVAVEINLLWQLQDRLHFLENDEKYSLQDLVDLRDGTLMSHLQGVMQIYTNHITQDCQICLGQGFICEFCKGRQIIFPFESDIECCTNCGSAYHLLCWLQNHQNCRKCFRKQQRLGSNLTENS